ncbi:hypothetical protein EXIGLDRAFT_460884, partial [Exidia glandulosa HHB12029]
MGGAGVGGLRALNICGSGMACAGEMSGVEGLKRAAELEFVLCPVCFRMRRVPSGLRMHWNDYITSTTRSPVTRNTNHMLHKSSHNTKLDHAVSIPIPPPKDRIKWWNIVPGDKVRIRGDKTSTLQEVYSVNKIANHVFLRGIRVSEKHQDLKPFNYSHLQLFVDHFEFPPKPGSDKPQIVPVFVRRWKMTTPRWNGDHLHWTRYAVATDPSLPGWDKTEPLEVPWPANTEQPPT